METTDTINPIEAITAEVEKALRAPDKLGLLSVRSANAWIEESQNTPMPKKYCHGLIVEGRTSSSSPVPTLGGPSLPPSWQKRSPEKRKCFS